jgi:hypothetical protein
LLQTLNVQLQLNPQTQPKMEYANSTPPPSLKSFIQTNIRQILLGSDLNRYSRQASRKNHAFGTPFC